MPPISPPCLKPACDPSHPSPSILDDCLLNSTNKPFNNIASNSKFNRRPPPRPHKSSFSIISIANFRRFKSLTNIESLQFCEPSQFESSQNDFLRPFKIFFVSGQISVTFCYRPIVVHLGPQKVDYLVTL